MIEKVSTYTPRGSDIEPKTGLNIGDLPTPHLACRGVALQKALGTSVRVLVPQLNRFGRLWGFMLPGTKYLFRGPFLMSSLADSADHKVCLSRYTLLIP